MGAIASLARHLLFRQLQPCERAVIEARSPRIIAPSNYLYACEKLRSRLQKFATGAKSAMLEIFTAVGRLVEHHCVRGNVGDSRYACEQRWREESFRTVWVRLPSGRPAKNAGEGRGAVGAVAAGREA